MKFLREDSLTALCSCASVSVGVPEGDLLMWSLRFNVSCVVRGEQGASRRHHNITTSSQTILHVGSYLS